MVVLSIISSLIDGLLPLMSNVQVFPLNFFHDVDQHVDMMEVVKGTLQDHNYSVNKNVIVKTVIVERDFDLRSEQDHNYSSPSPRKECPELQKRILRVEHSYSSAAENITNVGDIESRRASERDHSYMRVIKNFFTIMRRLVINADDFGYCPQRNDGIVQCYKAGGITSSSLMVNGSAAVDAVRQAKELGLPIGLHLNLTEGHPISPKTTNSMITDSSGHFLGKHGFRDEILSASFEKDIVRNEIIAQIELFSKLCGALPGHVDGHQHAHVVPGVSEIFAAVMQQYGIRWTRLPLDHFVKTCDWIPDPVIGFVRQVITEAQQASSIFDVYAIRYPRKFIGMTTMGNAMTSERLQEQLLSAFQNNLPQNDYAKNSKMPSSDIVIDSSASLSEGDLTEDMTCEVMVHPGFVNVCVDGGCGSGPDEFSKSVDREHEMRILTSNAMIKFYEDQGYQVCSYGDIS